VQLFKRDLVPRATGIGGAQHRLTRRSPCMFIVQYNPLGTNSIWLHPPPPVCLCTEYPPADCSRHSVCCNRVQPRGAPQTHCLCLLCTPGLDSICNGLSVDCRLQVQLAGKCSAQRFWLHSTSTGHCTAAVQQQMSALSDTGSVHISTVTPYAPCAATYNSQHSGTQKWQLPGP
jgi:hypothetical protein